MKQHIYTHYFSRYVILSSEAFCGTIIHKISVKFEDLLRLIYQPRAFITNGRINIRRLQRCKINIISAGIMCATNKPNLKVLEQRFIAFITRRSSSKTYLLLWHPQPRVYSYFESLNM